MTHPLRAPVPLRAALDPFPPVLPFLPILVESVRQGRGSVLLAPSAPTPHRVPVPTLVPTPAHPTPRAIRVRRSSR
ncbi:hypothetical protein GCM10010421_28520 [Streptomyces glaucus]|uniref:Secreted protein n=1 Tax=Streptomyces glaucus TaxID=284029 RepID=A0ABP5WUT2_9ACTN